MKIQVNEVLRCAAASLVFIMGLCADGVMDWLGPVKFGILYAVLIALALLCLRRAERDDCQLMFKPAVRRQQETAEANLLGEQ